MKIAQFFLRGSKGPEAVVHPDYQLVLDPSHTIKQQRSQAYQECRKRGCVGFQIMWGKIAITPYMEYDE